MQTLLRLTAACFTICVLLGCRGGTGKTIDFKFNAPKGTRFSYNVETKMNVNEADAGTDIKVGNDITMGYVFEITSDSMGWKTIQATIAKAAMNVDANGMNAKYDSDEPGNDSAGPMAKLGMFSAVKGGQFIFTINRNGEIGSVNGMQEMIQKILSRLSPDDTLAAGQAIGSIFTERGFKQNLQQCFAMYPGKPVKVGDSWNKTLAMEYNDMAMKLDNTYTLESLEGTVAKIKVVSKVTPAPGISEKNGQMDFTGDMTGLNSFNLTTGLPANGESNMRLDIKTKMHGNETPMKMDLKMTVTGKKI